MNVIAVEIRVRIRGGGYHHRDSAVIAPKPTALDNKIHPHDGVMGRSYLR